jgi:hypothetical protein
MAIAEIPHGVRRSLPGGIMVLLISSSVGRGGFNAAADCRTVQTLLNAVPSALGGPTPALAVDGRCGPLTIGAIGRFQGVQFNWADLRVDPGGPTLIRLNIVTGQPGAGAMTTPTMPPRGRVRPPVIAPAARTVAPALQTTAPASNSQASSSSVVAMLQDVKGFVSVRPGGGGWGRGHSGQPLTANSNVYGGQTVLAGDTMDWLFGDRSGSATVRFTDGTAISVTEGTLVVIYAPKRQPIAPAPIGVTMDEAEVRRALRALRGEE